MNSDGDGLVPRTMVAVGDRIVAGRYLVRAVIGRGGVGHVFEVENESIGRRFALKILLGQLVEPDQIKRFHREARALGRIQSPHVAQVIDFAVDPHIGPYLVMELLDGETLRDRLTRCGRLPVDEALAVALALCQALDEVHRVGIVHRDLKPSNIGLPRDGEAGVKLLDFGLAASTDGAFSEQLTHSQQFLGTMPYMAPELLRGTSPSPSFDLYALGVVLFQMVTGRTPYQGTTPAVYIQQHLLAPIPWMREVAPEVHVPGWLDDLVHNLLAKLPTERLASAAAVAHAITKGQAGQPIRLAPKREGVGWRRALLVMTALAAIGGGAVAARQRWARRPSAASATVRASAPASAAAPASATAPLSTPAAPPAGAALPATAAPPAPARATDTADAHRRKRRLSAAPSSQASRTWHGEIIETE
ncbi:MAG: serine/threonine protein kinase [Myxococcales bacterium]|nr:serine/threonine protein kinase [Myxococcales bacterium]